MKSLLNNAWSLVLYACLATLISQAIIAGYVLSAWSLDGARWAQAIDAARGAPLNVEGPAKASAPEPAAEQPSYEQILEVRALKDRDLELREHQVQNELAQVHREQSDLGDEQKKIKRIRQDFNDQLTALQQKAASAGQDDVRRTLESIDSKQAKQLILEMLEKNEMDDVVTLLVPMPDNKRAKIIGEFTTQELEKVAEVLREIRKGRPESRVSEATQKKLKE